MVGRCVFMHMFVKILTSQIKTLDKNQSQTLSSSYCLFRKISELL